jgi:hypothetical protein
LSQWDSDFEQWWLAYPHRVGKGAAQKAYRTARQKTDAATLLTAVTRYVDTKPPDRVYCNPATWLNQERWQDQPATDDGKSTTNMATAAAMAVAARLGETHP